MSRNGGAYKWYASKQLAKILIKDENQKEALKLLTKSYNSLSRKEVYETFDYAEFLKNNEKFEESIPFYTLIIALIGASLIIEPKINYFLKSHKLNIFIMGSFTIILSQISLNYFFVTTTLTYLILFLPIILVICYYLILNIFTNFKLYLL